MKCVCVYDRERRGGRGGILADRIVAAPARQNGDTAVHAKSFMKLSMHHKLFCYSPVPGSLSFRLERKITSRMYV